MRFPRLAVVPVAVAMLLAAGGSHAAQPTEKQIDEFTDAIVSLLPLGTIMETAAAADPRWPVQDAAPDAITPEQLACLRRELNADGFRRYKRSEVAEYLKTHGGNVQEEIALTRQAAPLLSSFMMAGAASADSKQEVDVSALIGKADADELLAMVSLARDPKYRALRELTGMGEAMSGEAPSEDNQRTGEMIAIKAMFHGFKQCNVSPGAVM